MRRFFIAWALTTTNLVIDSKAWIKSSPAPSRRLSCKEYWRECGSYRRAHRGGCTTKSAPDSPTVDWGRMCRDRKSTRLNSSHRCISYAVFCLKKKNKKTLE